MTQTQPDTTTSLTGKWMSYPAYKDSGVEWLGEIPVHWQQAPLKRYLTSLKDGTHGTFERVLEGVPLLSAKNVINGQLEISDQESLISYADYQAINRNGYLKLGDLLLTIVGTIGRAAIFDGPEPVAFQRSVAVLRFRSGQEVRYFYYLTQASYFQTYLVLSTKQSAQSGVYLSNVAYLPALLPSVPEQHVIATFLDRETAKINTLIAKKERLVELLQEKRAALINQAVTKGLDPAALMKDSGVEWLGEIPAHWEIRQFKRVAEISYGLTLELDRTETQGTPIISLPNVTKEGQLLLEDVPLTPLTYEEKRNLLLLKGDLLFNWRNGSPDHVGKTAYFNVDGEYTHVSFLLRIRFDPTKYNSHYYQMLLNNLRNREFFSSAKNRVNKTYNQTELGNLQVLIPPFKEQKMIAAYLDHETAKIDALISRIREGIEKLKEYSTALISAAVTGKIDVRGEITPSDGTDL